jgi:predicted small lipoprotein YifL
MALPLNTMQCIRVCYNDTLPNHNGIKTMEQMYKALTIICLMLALSGCGAQCPEETIIYLPDASALPIAGNDMQKNEPSNLEIRTLLGRKSISVDEVIRGPICNDTWSGTVYVTCDIAIPAWEENPFFLEECPVTIEPGTTVYVEAHRDKAYYEGCSCHE